jgi:colicin import membrane protein
VTIARTARARKLLAVETARVAACERDLAVARRALEEREAAAARAEADARAADSRWLDAVSVDDLAQASAHRRALEARLVQAKQAMARAATEVRARELEAIAARIAERRFEILIEGFVRADEAREDKVERRTADEHAARRRDAT